MKTQSCPMQASRPTNRVRKDHECPLFSKTMPRQPTGMIHLVTVPGLGKRGVGGPGEYEGPVQPTCARVALLVLSERSTFCTGIFCSFFIPQVVMKVESGHPLLSFSCLPARLPASLALFWAGSYANSGVLLFSPYFIPIVTRLS